MAGRPTVHGLHGDLHRGWAPFELPPSSASNDTGITYNNKLRFGMAHDHDNEIRLAGMDPMRSWVLAAMWIIASCVE
jgi:hypothetical protein